MSLRRGTSALIGALLLIANAATADELKLLRITPAGEDVEAGQQQIVLAFDRAVVPLGRMERKPEEVPVTITPALPCEWRWLDTTTLACQLPEDAALTPATAYTVEVRPELVADSGAKLLKGMSHRFITGRPALRYGSVASWRSPSLPVIRAVFDQPVTAASLQAAASLGGAPVIVEADPQDDETPYYVPALHGMPAGEARRQWRVLPVKPLPADRDGDLQVGPGLISAFGTERGVASDNAAPFHTFADLRLLGLQCVTAGGQTLLTRPGDKAPLCDPLSNAALVSPHRSKPKAMAAN